MRSGSRLGAAWLCLLLAAPAVLPPSLASAKDKAAAKVEVDQTVADVQHAIDERRFIDAEAQLDTAVLSGAKDPRLTLLGGQISLSRGRYDDALSQFRAAEQVAAIRAAALEGEGLALALNGRSKDALPVLKKAVAEGPGQWRAWNALGGLYDDQRAWADADDAYAKALTASDAPAIVLNNRGYSRLLRNQLDGAVADFVEVLRLRPDLEVARTNLRLAMALKGEYARATAGGDKADQAVRLNNAGFAALVRGDYGKAESLLQEAIQQKGQYYDLAAANLELVRQTKSHSSAVDGHDR